MRRAPAKRAALRTMEGNAFEICDRQSVVCLIFTVLRRSRPEDVVDIARGVLKLDIRDGETLCANDDETKTCREFTLEGIGQTSSGYAPNQRQEDPCSGRR